MKKKVIVSPKNKDAFATIERLAQDQETGCTLLIFTQAKRIPAE